MLKNNLLFTEGLAILGGALTAAVLGYFIHPIVFAVALFFILFSLYFFRNPLRVCSEAQGDLSVIVSPSDGKVLAIEQGQFEKGFEQKITIFLSPLDVHVNWLPIAGFIEDVCYRPGKFLLAFTPKSSELNERNDLLIRAENHRVLVRQIAGTVARRIVCWVRPGQYCASHDKYGMIRFGSRIELFLPKNVQVIIKQADRVYGGQTVIGKWLE